MRITHDLIALALFWACAGPAVARSAAFTDDDFVQVSGQASPVVRYACRRERRRFLLAVEVAEGAAATLEAGVHARHTVMLTRTDASVERVRGEAEARRFVFRIPNAHLVVEAGDWTGLRLGLAVAWPGGPFGQERQRERFLHRGGAPHLPLAQDPAQWLPFDLGDYEAAVAERRQRLFVDFRQPCDGKATIVIEDAAGKRVRNLISGRSLDRGHHAIAWDGLDEQGTVVPAGTYRWRAISHPGIRPEYLFSFCNDGQPPWRTGSGTDMWGPDHSTLTAAAAGREWTFLGGPVAESGYAMVAVDGDGTKRRHYDQVHGTGLWAIALAADERFLYAAHDGLAWGEHLDRSKSGWKATLKLSLTRYDIASGRVEPYPGGARFVVLAASEVGPGSAHPDRDGAGLTGLAMVADRLYVGDRASDSLLVVAADSATRLDMIPLPAPGPLAAAGDGLLVVSADRLVHLDPATKAVTVRVPAGMGAARGLAVAGDAVCVSDGARHTVRVFDREGRQVRELGVPGGPYAGAWMRERLVNPRGLAFGPHGWLWVTEDRWNPKRVAAWELGTGTVLREKFGPTAYGASEAGFDTADHGRWLGQGAQWQLDFGARTATPTSILFPQPGHLGGATKQAQYAFHRQDGRVFLIGLAGVSFISVLQADGSVRDLAFIGSTHRFSFGCDWRPPAAFVEAFNRAYPDRTGRHADKGPGVLWVDANGDGQCQADEFSFSVDCEDFAGAYWGHRQYDLTLRVPARIRGQQVLVTLAPDGFLPGGAPRYPALADACARAVPIDLDGNQVETAVDRFGDLICNTDPEMKAFGPDGRTLWTFPNRWTNVHGSHHAPLPEPGVMQGALYFLGMPRFDDRADVFVVNGNHGRFFVLTSDGFYLDEMFKDVRMGLTIDANLIGGECFGGFFGRSEKDGNYYLQSGHTDYRIFRVHGLSEARRSTGPVRVSPVQVIAAASAQVRREAASPAIRKARSTWLTQPPTIDGEDSDWPRGNEIRWDKSGRFPVTVRVAVDARNLYVLWHVQDDSPWVNTGKDRALLFKTGDSVDLQLGTDPAADPARRGPVPGDQRLLIAPHGGHPIAVLYRHRLAGGATTPVTFSSPWRNEEVAAVTVLERATVAVRTGTGEYKVEAAIPLDVLGLRPPGGFGADFGVLYGDPAGTMTMLRSYWSNQATGLVSDIPGEIMLTPSLWGALDVEGPR